MRLRSSPRAHSLRSFAVLVALALLSLFALAPRAHAQSADPQRASTANAANPAEATDAVTASPRDVPLVMQPSSVRLTPLPKDFVTRDDGWLVISYPPSIGERVDPLRAVANDVKMQLEGVLGEQVLDHVEVRVARTPEEMAELAPVDLPPPAYASGVAYPPLHFVLLTLTAPITSEGTDLDEVFRHELTHIALEDAVLGHHVPRWFTEGLAVHESGEASFARAHTLWDATLSKTVLPLSELDRGFPDDNRYEVSIAYAESADFLRFLLRSADRARFVAMISRVRAGMPFDRALGDAYGTDIRKLEYEWREELSKRYGYLPMLTGGSVVWVGIVGLMGVGYWRKRRQSKAKLAEWDAEERAADEAATLRARAETSVDAETLALVKRVPVNLPMVEHKGSWHTLH